MKVINRNFFRVLRSGAFNDDEQLEPMSKYKWKKLIDMAIRHDVENIVIKTLLYKDIHNGFFFPDEIKKEWNDILDNKLDKESIEKEIESDNFNVHLDNHFLNHRLQKIISTEHHSIDTNTETLHLLKFYIEITSRMLHNGLKIQKIIHLGQYLRNSGDKVDYVKFEIWLKQLHLRKIIALENSILIQLFKFTPDEFPFMNEEDDKAAKMALRDINATGEREIHFRQSNSGFVHNKNNKATLWHIRHSSRLFKYYPLEVMSNFIHNLASSLSEIEE